MSLINKQLTVCLMMARMTTTTTTTTTTRVTSRKRKTAMATMTTMPRQMSKHVLSLSFLVFSAWPDPVNSFSYMEQSLIVRSPSLHGRYRKNSILFFDSERSNVSVIFFFWIVSGPSRNLHASIYYVSIRIQTQSLIIVSNRLIKTFEFM